MTSETVTIIPEADHGARDRFLFHSPVALESDRSGRKSESANSGSHSELVLWLYRHPRVYESLREIRSLFRRIEKIWRQATVVPAYMGPVWQRDQSGSYRPHTRTRARKQGIAGVLDSHPWATLEDCRLVLAGCGSGRGILCRHARFWHLPKSIRSFGSPA